MKKLKMKKNNTPGMLRTFCGLDGCGKTTMLRRLADALEGEYELLITKQPTSFVRSSDIFRTYMDCPDHSAYEYRSLSLLAASDRLQHVKSEIVPAMAKGRIVLSDRYFYSCLANLRARGFEGDRWIYEIAEHVIRPDIAFFFDAGVDTAISRVRSREEEKDRYIDIKLQMGLKEQYKKICRENGGVMISTEIPMEETYSKVINRVRKELLRHYGNKR